MAIRINELTLKKYRKIGPVEGAKIYAKLHRDVSRAGILVILPAGCFGFLHHAP